MTPTLLGRWQMRLFLLPTAGLLATIPFTIGLLGPRSWAYLIFLLYMGILGCISDLCAQQLQKLRWDSDWPGLLQLAGAAIEAIILAIVLQTDRLPGISTKAVPLHWLLLQYILVSLSMFLATPSLLRVLFPHSRFRGGQWL
jgi:hypothetical protein